jgi:hypothetical protein
VNALGDDVRDALWFYDTDAEVWELHVVLKAPGAKADPREYYERIQGVFLSQEPPLSFDLTDVRVVSADAPVIQALRSSVLAEAAGVSGVRLGGNRLGNVFIKEAYLYKIGP